MNEKDPLLRSRNINSPQTSQTSDSVGNENIGKEEELQTTFCCLHLKSVENYKSPSDPEENYGHLDAKLKSLCYDNCENEIYLKEEKSKTFKQLRRKGIARWIVMLLVGVVTALIACLIDISVTEFSHIKFKLLVTYFKEALEEKEGGSLEGGSLEGGSPEGGFPEGGSLAKPVSLWVAWDVAFVSIASFAAVYGEPISSGSGIPQIKCFLNGIKIPRVVRIKTLVCKVIGVICSVVGGLVVGKEGPMIHSGAVVAAGISQGRSTSFGFDLKVFEYFRNDQEKRDFVSAGAAAGVSAAFGAPVGGILFSLEEGASFWNQSLTWRIFFASLISTFTLNIILSAYHGMGFLLNHHGLINFGKFQDTEYVLYEIPLFILFGIIGGLLGSLYNFFNFKLTLFRIRNISKNWMKFIEALLISSSTTLCAFFLIYVGEDCQPIGKDPNPNPLQLFCPDGKSSTMATLWFQSPESSLKSLFHDPYGTYDWKTLSLFFIFYLFLSCWTFGMAVPSGLFIPCLVIGASWGRLFFIFLKYFLSNSLWIDPGKFALLGAAAQLGGTVRMTLSLTVILIEATGNISFGLPLMIVLVFAKWTGDLFNPGIYDSHIHLQGVPFLEPEPPPLTSNVTAREVMSYPVSTLGEVESVKEVVDLLRRESHDGFPVVNKTERKKKRENIRILETFGILKGFITRTQLIFLLSKKHFINNNENLDISLTTSMYRDTYPRFPKINEIILSELDLDQFVDLRPIINPAPYTVYDNMSLTRIFKLFRGLGLSHLMVINNHNEVIGIVTRKDLARYHCSRKRFWKDPVLCELPMATEIM